MRIAEMMNIFQKFLTLVAWRKQKWSQTKKKHKNSVKSIIFLLFLRKLNLVSII